MGTNVTTAIPDLVINHWNSILTILATAVSIGVGYRQYKHLKAQRPSIEVTDILNSEYFEGQDQEGKEVQYEVSCTVNNEGYQSDTVLGGRLISPPPKKYNLSYWSQYFDFNGNGTVELSTDKTTVKGTGSKDMQFSEHAPSLVDGMLETDQVDALLVVETTNSEAHTNLTLKKPFS